MSETTGDIYSRLGDLIEAWNAQILESHEVLAGQLQTARGHLDRLIQPAAEESQAPAPHADSRAAVIAALEQEVADLRDELQRARTTPPLVGAPPSEPDREGVSRQREWADEIEELQRKLAASEEIRETLRGELATLKKTEGQALEDSSAASERAEASIGELERERDQLRADMAAALERCAALETALAEAETGAGASGEELAAALERCAALETALAEAEEALAAAQVSDADQAGDEERAGLAASLSALQDEHGQALARIGELEAALAGGAAARSARSLASGGDVHIDAFDTQGHKKRMGEILMELGVLDEEQLKAVLKEQSADPQHRLGALVVEHGFTGEDIVSKILAAQLRLPYLDIADLEIEDRVLKLVSPHVTRLHRCVPLKEEGGLLTAAMVNPLDLIAIEDLELASRCQVSPVVSTPSQIDARLLSVYGPPEVS